MSSTLCIAIIVRNEATYILEWIAYYRSQGFFNFLFYDNGSDDGTTDICMALAEAGHIDFLKWPSVEGRSPQLSAYKDALTRLRDRFEFVAFFDADEFLVNVGNISLLDWLANAPETVSALAINQRVFGSSGQTTRQEGLVIERFCNASEPAWPENRWVKTVARISATDDIISSHRVRVRSGRYVFSDLTDAFAPDGDSGEGATIDRSHFQLNHYILKSEEEFQLKRSRGGVASADPRKRLERYASMEFFHGRDAHINSARDESLISLVPEVKREIERLRACINI